MNATNGTTRGEGFAIGDLLDRTVAAAPAALAVVDGEERLDWATFAVRVDGYAHRLAGHGIGHRDRIALWLPNGVGYLGLIFAAARIGAMVVHVNTRLGPAEVGDLVHRTGARMLVAHPGLAEKAGRAALPLDPIFLDDVDPAEMRGVFHGIGGASDDALVYTTGGTTARPKLVVHRQSSITAHARTVAEVAGFDRAGACYLAAVPFCGTFGNIGAMAAVAGGATLVMMATFDPDTAAVAIREHRVTHLLGDDRMVDRLAATGPFEGIRFCGAAAFGADARPALARGVEAGLAPRAIYGSSEVQALFALGDPGADGWGAVAPVSADATATVVGDELRLAGPSLFDRYLDDAAATDAAFADGLFCTNDRATAEGVGFVFDGRIGDVLRLGGFLVAPQEIEAFLVRQHGVAQAQVVAVEGERGASAFAFVIPDDGALVDEAVLIAACRAALARYKVPIRVVALPEFPVSNGPNGPKIARADLRRRAIDIVSRSNERSAA